MTSAHGPEDVRIFHKECVSLAKAGYEVYEVARGESYDKNGVHIVGIGEIPGDRLKRMTVGAKMSIGKRWRWIATSIISTTRSCCLTV